MRVVLVGQPNVGKSSILNLLCGFHVLVSNYAGTTVELGQASLLLGSTPAAVVDTPGLYRLRGRELESRVVRSALVGATVVVNVLDATDLARGLHLTLELTGLGLPMVVVVNQLDRARARDWWIDTHGLAARLGVAVVGMVATRGEGKDALLGALGRAQTPAPAPGLSVPELVAEVVRGPAAALPAPEGWMRHPWLAAGGVAAALAAVAAAAAHLLAVTERLVLLLLRPVYAWLGPLAGSAGRWGALAETAARALPEGLVVPVGTVLPAMVVVYLCLGLLEDSGLLARLAAAVHGPGRWCGLPGSALLPLVLGCGCRAPAVLATRILPRLRERFITCTLIATVVPCAATLAVISALVAVKRASAAVVGVTAAGAALALARTLEVSLPGPAAALILELPPVRWPRLGNVAQKSRARLRGFFTTVLPALVGCNLAVRLFLQSRYLTALSGLDPLAAAAFGLTGPALAGLLVTVFQRYLAPLVLLSLELTPRQATIAASMVCVSFPCLPVVVLCWRELGGRRCGQLLALATLLPVVTGGCLHRVLP